jgi:hypothetical protein
MSDENECSKADACRYDPACHGFPGCRQIGTWADWLKQGRIRDWPQAQAEVAFLAFRAGWEAGRAQRDETDATREHMAAWLRGEESHPGEGDDDRE